MSLNQSYTLSALQPVVPQVPLLLQPFGEHPPPLVPQEEQAIILILIYKVTLPGLVFRPLPQILRKPTISVQ